jgi:hypothetical protein
MKKCNENPKYLRVQDINYNFIRIYHDDSDEEYKDNSFNDNKFIKQDYCLNKNEEDANSEIEFKYRKEFEEYYYENYIKKGYILDDNAKNLKWLAFRLHAYYNQTTIISKIKSTIINFLEQLEDKYDL